MAIVNVPDKNLTLRNADEITKYLASIGIDYERWESNREVSPDASEAEILEIYATEIERLKTKGCYVNLSLELKIRLENSTRINADRTDFHGCFFVII